MVTLIVNTLHLEILFWHSELSLMNFVHAINERLIFSPMKWIMQNSLRTYILIYIYIAVQKRRFFPLILTDVIRLVIHELPSFPPPPQRQGDQLVIIWGVRLSLNFIIKKLQTHACLWCWYIYSTQLFSLSTFRKWWWGNTLKGNVVF